MKPIMIKKIEKVVQSRFDVLNNIKSTSRAPKCGFIQGNRPTMQRRDSFGNVISCSLVRKPSPVLKKNQKVVEFFEKFNLQNQTVYDVPEKEKKLDPNFEQLNYFRLDSSLKTLDC